MSKTRVCPRCGKMYTDPPALSRIDNETEICSECGVQEALAAANNYFKQLAETQNGGNDGREKDVQ